MNVLFFVQPGTNSRHTLLDLMRGVERAGHRVFHWDLEPMWQASARASEPALRHRFTSEFTAMVRSFLTTNRIDLSVAMWANGLTSLSSAVSPDGRVATVFDLIEQPHICYWLDAPHWAHEGAMMRLIASGAGQVLRSPRLHHVINNAATAIEMRELFGFAHVHAASYGINEETFRPHYVSPDFDLVLAVGPGDPAPTPLARQLLESRQPELEPLRHEFAERLRPAALELAERLSSGSSQSTAAAHELVNRLIQTQLESRQVPMLARLQQLVSADPGMFGSATRLSRDPALYVELTSLVRSIEAAERAFTFAVLSRRFRCAAFGPGVAGLEPWTSRATNLGVVEWDQQSAAYCRGRIGLNIMRWQDDEGLNVKPYEITASGRACLCARRRGLEELFEPGREIAVFEGPAAAVQTCEALLSDEPVRQRMAEAGRLRTQRDHTWTAVAGRILTHVQRTAAADGRAGMRQAA